MAGAGVSSGPAKPISTRVKFSDSTKRPAHRALLPLLPYDDRAILGLDRIDERIPAEVDRLVLVLRLLVVCDFADSDGCLVGPGSLNVELCQDEPVNGEARGVVPIVMAFMSAARRLQLVFVSNR